VAHQCATTSLALWSEVASAATFGERTRTAVTTKPTATHDTAMMKAIRKPPARGVDLRIAMSEQRRGARARSDAENGHGDGGSNLLGEIHDS